MTDSNKLSMLRNTGLSYFGQAYALLIGIVILPFYLGHLGAEAYGLIGFFAVMQAWLQLLDAGMSPALVRQVAHFRGQPMSPSMTQHLGQLLRSFEIIFLPMALLAALVIQLSSAWIATHWLRADILSPETIGHCVGLMGLMVGMRLYATLYKSGIQGMELHAWLNGANMVVATLRYLGGLWLVARVSQDPLDFFLFQTGVALLEMLLFACKAHRLMPSPALLTGFNWQAVRPVLPFAASLSFTSLLWILLTQLDKVLLSNVLSLEDYGYFSLVALISTGIMTLTNPLVQTLLPRLTMLTSQGRDADMQALYLAATRFVCSLLFPLAAVVAMHSEELIYAWTGDREAARWSASILPWYVLGSAIMAISAFQFYLQYAYGRLRLHVWYSLVSTGLAVPLVVYAVFEHGARGAAVVWFALRLITFLVWPPVVHQRFAPRLHAPWLRDLLRICLMTAIGLALSAPLFDALASDERLDIFMGLAASGALCLLLIAATTRPVVNRLFLFIHKPSI